MHSSSLRPLGRRPRLPFVLLPLLPLVAAACGSQGSSPGGFAAVTGTTSDASADGARGAADGSVPVEDAGSDAPVDASGKDVASGGADAAGGTDATGGSDATGGRDASGGTDATGGGDATGSVDSGSSGPCGPENPAVVPLPVIGAQSFTVTTFGAKGDGTTDNTPALQAALDAAGAAGGGTVNVPAGTFLSGPIVLHSATRLALASGATLEMLPMASYPGTTAFITANDAQDIALTGSGTIEGQGQAWWNALTATPTLVRPQEVSFTNSTRVLISGIRLQNPPEEHIWVKGDTDVTVTGITIQTLAVSGQHAPNNTDGVDISANGVFFCQNSIACGDDNVVMEGTHIYVAYSQFGVGHGCTIGSITSGGVSDVTVDNVTMTDTTSGIRMKSARGRGGLVTNLTYSNMTLTGVTDPIFIASYYPTLPTDPTTDPAQAVTSTTPQWTNITLKNIKVVGSPNAGTLWGLPEAKIANVVFDNVSVQATTGMDIFHATGISFINGSSVTVTSGAPVITDDATVSGIATQAFP